MASADRPFSEVLSSIFGNFEDIVRSEIKLAKTEVREEIVRTAVGAQWVAIGVVSAFFALAFLLVAAFFGLLYLVPNWAAALILFLVLGAISATALQVHSQRRRQLTRRTYALNPTLASQEYVPWTKQATK